MTKRYHLTALEYVYYEIEVEADSEQDAIDKASDTHFNDWTVYDTDQWDIEAVTEIKDD